MLRRIPTTLLVCLAISMLTYAGALAAGPDESLEVLLKSDSTINQAPVAKKAKSAPLYAKKMAPGSLWMCPAPIPGNIAKVKPVQACAPFSYAPQCILPKPGPGQWDMSVQAFFARTKGSIAWPRYAYIYNQWYRDVDLNDDLKLDSHRVLAQFTAKYQFRQNWALRYSVLADDSNGGGYITDNNPFYFGNQLFNYGQTVQSRWRHQYHRLGLVYDAVRNCSSAISVFADWAHIDDRIDVWCSYCGYQASTFSKGGDSAVVGMELQRCLKTQANGGTLSLDHKAGVIFLDNVEGWDVQAGARYSVPLNYGRWGYVKGGYRLVDLKKSQSDFVFDNSLEGGYMEFGFIF